MSDTSKVVAGMLVFTRFIICTPIWYYLLYRILIAVHADAPMWIAYWVYVPVGLFFGAIEAWTDQILKS